MTNESSFTLPPYATYASEVVGTFYMEVWIDQSTRWLRIDIVKDLVGNYGPFTCRIFKQGEFQSDAWGELEDYPWWTGNSPEEVIEKCLAGLAERADIIAGMEYRDSLPEDS